MFKIEMLPVENRCGIYTIQFAEFDNLLGGRAQIRLINSKSNELLYDGIFDIDSLCSHGCHIHSALLPEGKYNFECVQGNRKFEVQFDVDEKDSLSLEVMAVLEKANTPIVFSASCDSNYYPYQDASCTPWFDKEDAIDNLNKMVFQQKVTEDEADKFKSFIENGFMIIENAFDDELIDLVNTEINHAIESGVAKYEYGSSKRIEHLHLHYPNIRKVWLNETVKKYIDKLFQSAARPCQTLTFVFGSQQDAHQDTIHLTPFPAGYMCGMWIALQDVVEGSGELVVYPGSHKEPRFRMSDMKCAKVKSGNWQEFGDKIVPSWEVMSKKYESSVYRPKKGTVLIWHENLLHAGSSRKDLALERRSMVIHYFAKGAVAYYDSTGLPGMAAPLKNFD